MDLSSVLSTEQITSFWDLFFFPLLYAGGTWFIFRLLWKEKLADFRVWLMRLYNNGSGIHSQGQPQSAGNATKVLMVFCGLLVIHTYGKLFTLIGGILPGYVEVSQSGLLIRMNTIDAYSDTLPRLWAHYNNIEDIDRFARLVIHNVSVLAAQLNTSYYAMQYAAMREDIAFLITTCMMIRMLIIIAVLAWVLACVDRIKRKVWLGNPAGGEKKKRWIRVLHTSRYVFRTYVWRILVTVVVLLFCLSFFSLNLMETLCKQAQNRCEFLLTFLEADNEVPSFEEKEHAEDKVFLAKDRMRVRPIPIGISESRMTGFMWDMCWGVRSMFPRLKIMMDEQLVVEVPHDDEEHLEEDNGAGEGKDDTVDWELKR